MKKNQLSYKEKFEQLKKLQKLKAEYHKRKMIESVFNFSDNSDNNLEYYKIAQSILKIIVD